MYLNGVKKGRKESEKAESQLSPRHQDEEDWGGLGDGGAENQMWCENLFSVGRDTLLGETQAT